MLSLRQIFQPTDQQPANVRWVLWLVTLLSVTLAVWFAYARILTLGFTGWDTLVLIEDNRFASLQDLWRIIFKPLTQAADFYRPLSQLSYAFDYLISHTNAEGYHLTDIFLHVFVCLGVTLLGYLASGKKIWGGLLCGTLFALHPALITTVFNISQRMDVLATLGIVWSLVLAYRALRGGGVVAYLLSCAALISSFAAKETGWIALPLLVLLCFFLQRQKGWRAVLRVSVPYLVLGIAFALLYRSIIPGESGGESFWKGITPEVSYLFLAETIVPNSLMGWREPLFLVFCFAIVGTLIQARLDRSLLVWFLLFGAWLAGLLILYVLVGVDEFVARYAYGIAAALVLFLGISLTLPIRRYDILALATHSVFVLFAVIWIANSPLLFFPIGAIRREQAATEYLEQFDTIISETPAGTKIELQNVPPKLIYHDGIKTWLKFKWAFKKIELDEQTQAPHARGHAFLSVERDSANGRVTISATYDNSFSEED